MKTGREIAEILLCIVDLPTFIPLGYTEEIATRLSIHTYLMNQMRVRVSTFFPSLTLLRCGRRERFLLSSIKQSLPGRNFSNTHNLSQAMARRFSTDFQRDASEHNTFVQGLGSIGTDSGQVITGGRAGVLRKPNIPASTPIQTPTRSSSSPKQHRPLQDNAPGPVRQQRFSNEYRPYSFTSNKHKDKRKSSYLERNTSVSTHLDKWRTEIPTRPTTQVPILPIIRITTGPASASAVSQNSTRIFSSGRTPFEAAMEKLMDPDEATASVASSKRAISDNWRLGISTKPTTQVPIPPIIRITTGPAASEAPRNSTRGYSSGLSPFKAAMDKLRNPDKAAQNAQMAPPHCNSSQLAHPPSPNEGVFIPTKFAK
ncbi:uncharacterized protein C8R40DRAFT_868536 [Lentinula edodes]|uniref:uncharacterized protein n=1 Tax=Lentinula edodes TaxID=5353 RepID=UPI001E8E999E|nr:uncharacterized protein C8R40DRAFT_868536 [Lentinula edodes]KAH7877841.1 hypothetical protein C8R40DRAFT_868536 [Lentinula edodes]